MFLQMILICSFTLSSLCAIERHGSLSYSRQEIHLLPEVVVEETAPVKRIIFLHIPQTAGTNVDNIACAVSEFGKQFHYQRLPVPRVPNRSPNLVTPDWIGGLKQLQDQPHLLDAIPESFLITGLFPYGLHTYFNVPCRYVTLVRNPLERELSHANFAYQRGYLSPEEFESYLMERMIDNPQVRLIAGREYMEGCCTEKTLAKAMENIERDFLLVAPSEDVDAFLQILAGVQGWGPLAYAPMQITHKKVVEELNPSLTDHLLQKHQWDLKLYEWVKARWGAYKEKIVLGTKELFPEDRVLTLMPDHLEARQPRFLSVSEIDAYNEAHKDEGLLELNQSCKRPPPVSDAETQLSKPRPKI